VRQKGGGAQSAAQPAAQTPGDVYAGGSEEGAATVWKNGAVLWRQMDERPTWVGSVVVR
jgi:hypothetical protein